MRQKESKILRFVERTKIGAEKKEKKEIGEHVYCRKIRMGRVRISIF